MYLIGFKGVGDLWQLGQFVPPAIILFSCSIMLHSFSLFRIANMPENWHQMDDNWLETINIYIQCVYEVVTIFVV